MTETSNPQFACVFSSSDSAEEAVTRALFTCFLNTGVFDQRMRDTKISPKSKKDADVGLAFVEKHPEIREELLTWAKKDPFGEFVVSDRIIRNRIAANIRCVRMVVGQRFKAVTGFGKKLEVKDPRKSFITKVLNRVMKLSDEWNRENSELHDRLRFVRTVDRGKSFEEWVQIALTGGYRYRFPSGVLREIHDLQRKYGADSDTIDELMKQVSVIGVMIK